MPKFNFVCMYVCVWQNTSMYICHACFFVPRIQVSTKKLLIIYFCELFIETLSHVTGLCVAGASVRDVCTKSDALMLEETNSVSKSTEQIGNKEALLNFVPK